VRHTPPVVSLGAARFSRRQTYSLARGRPGTANLRMSRLPRVLVPGAIFLLVLAVVLVASSPKVRHRIYVIQKRRRHGLGRHDV